MASQSQKVTLYYTCKTPQGTWKRFPAAIGRNGKIRPRYAQVGDAQICYPGGHYILRHSDTRRTVWTNAGTDAAQAQAQQMHLAKLLTAQDAAEDAGTGLVETPGMVSLKSKAAEFHARQIARGKKRAAVQFRQAFEEFLSVVRVPNANQLTEMLILRWYAALRSKNSDRTIYNKHVSIFGFLTWAGVDTKKLAKQAPSYTEKAVEVYRSEELKQFFASLGNLCTGHHFCSPRSLTSIWSIQLSKMARNSRYSGVSFISGGRFPASGDTTPPAGPAACGCW